MHWNKPKHLNSSLPSWERGLKLDKLRKKHTEIVVAPLVGAWIETSGEISMNCLESVAPLVGAWIETEEWDWTFCCNMKSLPSWERGLKQGLGNVAKSVAKVAPLVGAWIETNESQSMFYEQSCRSPRGSVD